jgi:hypothetical protein
MKTTQIDTEPSLMTVEKTSIKLYSEGQPPVESAFIPVFHSWIQNDVMDDLLLDVADYSHVPAGPGVMLIAESGSYNFEQGVDERYGMVYSRKDASDNTNSHKITRAFTGALDAAVKLVSEPALAGLRFSGNEFRLTFYDRLSIPNSDDSLLRLKADIDSVLDRLFAGEDFVTTRISKDPREALTVRITGPQNSDLATLKSRLPS